MNTLNTKIMAFTLTLGALLASAANADYSIKATNGSTVTVAAQDLVDAYAAMQADTRQINVRVENSDASISIINPRLIFQGRLMEITGDIAYQGSMEGACKFFKLGTEVIAEYGTRGEGVAFNPNGTVRTIEGSESDDNSWPTVRVLTCHRN